MRRVSDNRPAPGPGFSRFLLEPPGRARLRCPCTSTFSAVQLGADAVGVGPVLGGAGGACAASRASTLAFRSSAASPSNQASGLGLQEAQQAGRRRSSCALAARRRARPWRSGAGASSSGQREQLGHRPSGVLRSSEQGALEAGARSGVDLVGRRTGRDSRPRVAAAPGTGGRGAFGLLEQGVGPVQRRAVVAATAAPSGSPRPAASSTRSWTSIDVAQALGHLLGVHGQEAVVHPVAGVGSARRGWRSGPGRSRSRGAGRSGRWPPPWMSIGRPRTFSIMAEHSMCQPGRPGPQGLSHTGSPGLDGFHSTKSAAFFL